MNNKIFESIFSDLQKNYHSLGETYYGKSMNQFKPDYLLDTPINRQYNPLPTGHSVRMLHIVTDMIAHAQHFVDMTNLGLPGGAFNEAIIEGIKKNPNKITMRILCGRGAAQIDTDGYVKYIQKEINKKDIVLHVGVQQFDHGAMPASWNHSKYLAVDGRTVLFGGHNFISEPYFGSNPIFELSVKLDGPVAMGAHLFSNALWTFVNKYVLDGRGGLTTFADSLENNIVTKRVAPMWTRRHEESDEESDAQFNVPVIHVAQPGLGILNDPGNKHPNPSLTALYTAIAHAENEICISQQDIGGEGGFGLTEGVIDETVGKVPFVGIRDPKERSGTQMNYYDVNLFNNLSTQLIAKSSLKIRIILTNVGSTNEGGNIPYSYGASYASVFRAFGWFLIRYKRIPVDRALTIIRNQIQIRTISFAFAERWDRGQQRIIGNHSKFWSVDNSVCYIGSHNMYPSTKHGLRIKLVTGHLQEWGAVIGNNNENIAGQIQTRYFNDLFVNFSSNRPFENDFLKNLELPS